jgi:hypothetical protein
MPYFEVLKEADFQASGTLSGTSSNTGWNTAVVAGTASCTNAGEYFSYSLGGTKVWWGSVKINIKPNTAPKIRFAATAAAPNTTGWEYSVQQEDGKWYIAFSSGPGSSTMHDDSTIVRETYALPDEISSTTWFDLEIIVDLNMNYVYVNGRQIARFSAAFTFASGLNKPISNMRANGSTGVVTIQGTAGGEQVRYFRLRKQNAVSLSCMGAAATSAPVADFTSANGTSWTSSSLINSSHFTGSGQTIGTTVNGGQLSMPLSGKDARKLITVSPAPGGWYSAPYIGLGLCVKFRYISGDVWLSFGNTSSTAIGVHINSASNSYKGSIETFDKNGFTWPTNTALSTTTPATTNDYITIFLQAALSGAASRSSQLGAFDLAVFKSASSTDINPKTATRWFGGAVSSPEPVDEIGIQGVDAAGVIDDFSIRRVSQLSWYTEGTDFYNVPVPLATIEPTGTFYPQSKAPGNSKRFQFIDERGELR